MTKSGKKKTTDAMKSILQNMLYAGFTKSRLVEEEMKGLHKALVPREIIETNIDIITGRKRNYSVQGDDLYPLKNVLRCSTCKLSVTASAPRSHTGDYHPGYHCGRKTCRKAVTGKRASISIDKAHEDFRAVLEALKPLDVGIERLFKDLIVRKWNDQYAQGLETMSELNRKIEEQRNIRHKASQKFIADKITEEERDMEHGIIDTNLVNLEEDLAEITQFMEAHKIIIDNAMQFITEPALFWNHASTPVKQMLQLLLFPNGVIYDFETGFGTFKKLESHLLIQKIADKSAININLVAATGFEPVTLGL